MGWAHDLTTRKQTRLSSRVLACLLEQNDQPSNNHHSVDIDHKMFIVKYMTMKRSLFILLTPVCLLFLSWIAQTLAAERKLLCSL